MPLITIPEHLKPPYPFEERESNDPELLKALYVKMQEELEIFLQRNVCTYEEFYTAVTQGSIEELYKLNVPAEYPPYLDDRKHNRYNKEREPVLVKALQRNELEIIQFLLEAGVSLLGEYESYDDYLSYAISLAAEKNYDNDKSVIELLINHWKKVPATHPRKNLPLHAACKKGKIWILEDLLKMGLDVNHTDKTGQTPLFAAANSGDDEKVEILLKAGADTSVRDMLGDKPLHSYCSHGIANPRVVTLLIKADADHDVANNDGYTPLWQSTFDPEDHEDKIPILRELLKNKVKVDFKDPEGDTPLLWVTRNCKNTTMAELLLKAEADPKAQDAKGNTPLHHATKQGNTQMVKLLLKYGADPKLVNKVGTTPEGLAREENKDECLNLLLEYPKKVEERAKAKKALEILPALEQELRIYKKKVVEQQKAIDDQTKLIEDLNGRFEAESRKRQKIAEDNPLDTSDQPSERTSHRFF